MNFGMLADSRFWLPDDFSEHGGRIDTLINSVHWFMAALFVGWGIFFVYCMVKFRQRPGHTANYTPVKAKVSKYLEVGIVVFEAFLLLYFSIPAWADYRNIPEPKEGADERFEVRVVAQQYAWNIHYPGPDREFGPCRPELVDETTNPVGLDLADPAAADDFVSINNFYMPVNREVFVRLSSKDVIHSFSMAKLRVKQDVIPGMETPIWFKAIKEGETDITCAQLCGLGHYRMKGRAFIVSQQAFDDWFAKASVVEEFDEDDFDD